MCPAARDRSCGGYRQIVTSPPPRGGVLPGGATLRHQAARDHAHHHVGLVRAAHEPEFRRPGVVGAGGDHREPLNAERQPESLHDGAGLEPDGVGRSGRDDHDRRVGRDRPGGPEEGAHRAPTVRRGHHRQPETARQRPRAGRDLDRLLEGRSRHRARDRTRADRAPRVRSRLEGRGAEQILLGARSRSAPRPAGAVGTGSPRTTRPGRARPCPSRARWPRRPRRRARRSSR